MQVHPPGLPHLVRVRRGEERPLAEPSLEFRQSGEPALSVSSPPPQPPPSPPRRATTTPPLLPAPSQTPPPPSLRSKMSWKFPIPTNFLGGNQQEQTLPNLQHIPTESWYPPSVRGSSVADPLTPQTSSGINMNRSSSRAQSPSRMQPSPAEAAGVIARLKDKSVDELRKLLNDRDAYSAFFNSLEQVQMQNHLREDLRKETLQLARENLEKEPRILELRNQCMIIRTTELATAHEKLTELEKQKKDMLSFYSPESLLQKLHDSMGRIEEEAEMLHRQLLNKEIDLATFMQKYKKLRQVYHRRHLIHLAARTS